MLNCKNKEFTYKIQTIFWDHIEYNIYSGTQKHKYFDWSAESLESSALRCTRLRCPRLDCPPAC